MLEGQGLYRKCRDCRIGGLATVCVALFGVSVRSQHLGFKVKGLRPMTSSYPPHDVEPVESRIYTSMHT